MNEYSLFLLQFVKSFWIEDVFITGVLPLYLEGRHQKLPGGVIRLSKKCDEIPPPSDILRSIIDVSSKLHDVGRCKALGVDAPTIYHRGAWKSLIKSNSPKN